MTLAWLQDVDDPRVVAALRETCTICKAKPGCRCRHPWETKEPLGRVVHQCRAESKMR